MGPKTDYTKPYIAQAGWGCCLFCKELTYIEIIQGLEEIDGDLVPDVYHRCWACGAQWTQWRSGMYDALVALYQMRARGLVIRKALVMP